MSPASPETRGFPGKRIDQRPPRGAGERREGISTPGGKGERERIHRSPGRDTPFRGIGEGSFERRAGERGGESRRSGEIRHPVREIRPQGGEMRRSGGESGRQGMRDGGRESGGSSVRGGGPKR